VGLEKYSSEVVLGVIGRSEFESRVRILNDDPSHSPNDVYIMMSKER